MSDEIISERMLPHVEQARAMGVDVDDVYVMHLFIQALKYVEARFQARNAGKMFRAEMEKITGESAATIEMWSISPYINIASQLIGEKLLSDLLEKDVRRNIIDVYAQDSLDWFKNMSRIAKGVKGPNAKSAPIERDQIDAFEALTASEMGQVFTRMMFLEHDDQDVTPQDLHLARQRELKGKAVKIEANIIEGEVKSVDSLPTPDEQSS